MELENIKQEKKCLQSAFMKNINKLDDFVKSTDKNLETIEITFEQLNKKYMNLKTKDEKFLNYFKKKAVLKKNTIKNMKQPKNITINILNIKLRLIKSKLV